MPRQRSSGELGRALLLTKAKQRKQAKTRSTTQKHVSDVLSVHGNLAASKLDSVVERDELEEFIDSALLAQRDFTAVRGDARIVGSIVAEAPQVVEETQQSVGEIYDYQDLPIPRRPRWTKDTAPEELELLERESFLEWRRGLASTESASKLAITPFEKNLNMWRQLWRVIERSDLVVQIVDSRNPLLFRCRDLQRYVEEEFRDKRMFLLVNKADLLSELMRKTWAEYFCSQGIQFAFCSAINCQERQRLESEELGTESDEEEALREEEYSEEENGIKEREELDERKEVPSEAKGQDPAIRIRSTAELLEMFRYDLQARLERREGEFLGTVGLVGYPNVGKSSMLNALIGEKKVGVAAMPGKTRHFQTVQLGDLMLCDCPGLVFPTFTSTKSALVCNGILPIDRMKDHQGPVEWICQRVSRQQIESTYGIKVASVRDDKIDRADASEVLQAYATVRGYMTSSGRPDEARASRYVLKDFVAGKLLYCHPPPTLETEEQRQEFFNSLEKTSLIHRRNMYEHLPQEEQEALRLVQEDLRALQVSMGNQTAERLSKRSFRKLSKREKARIRAHQKGMGETQKYRRTVRVEKSFNSVTSSAL